MWLRRFLCASVCIAALNFVVSASAQAGGDKEEPTAAGASPAFEVATIKPSDPNATGGWGFPVDGRHVGCVNASVATILSVAYGIHDKQVVDGPEWVRTDHYDISGVASPGHPDLAQMQEMYRKLLADRFHFVFHRDTRELPIYAVRVANGGPKIVPAKPGEHLNTGNRGSGGQRTLKFTNMPMSAFALNMNFYVDRPVVDQTGLNGAYDFTLTWTWDDARINDTNAAPSLFTAVKEQLGLKLEAVKGPAEVLAIDRIERPSEN
jgi:uncharacterized protein (TIGR03435 family)